MIDFKSQIAARQSDWIARRRDLHSHPELGFTEIRTAGIVANELARLGLEVQTGVGQTGVVGSWSGRVFIPRVRAHRRRGAVRRFLTRPERI